MCLGEDFVRERPAAEQNVHHRGAVARALHDARLGDARRVLASDPMHCAPRGRLVAHERALLRAASSGREGR